MKRRIFIVSLWAIILGLLSSVVSLFPSAFAQEEEALLLFKQIPIVVTATRTEQTITKSPSSIYVITAEDIKQSGATQLEEALTMVPGVDFGYTTSGRMSVVGLRGFHSGSGNKLIFMVDSVPYNTSFYSLTEITTPPISLAEIERIEILKGPGSSLYGSNALFGVINVITKKPKDTQGSLISVMGGQYNTFLGTYLYGGAVKDKLYYRLSITHAARDEWGKIAYLREPSKEYSLYNANLNYNLDDNSELDFFGYTRNNRRLNFTEPDYGVISLQGQNDAWGGVVSYSAKKPNIILRAYRQHRDTPTPSVWMDLVFMDFPFPETGSSGPTGSRNDITGVEFQHTINPLKNDTLVWGANYLHAVCASFTLDGERRHDTRGVFVDNTYEFNDRFSIVTGLRHDHHPNTGDFLSHRLALLYAFNQDDVLRFTWANSFRNPNMVEFYDNLSFPIIPGVMIINQTGNERIKNETAETFELAYRNKLNDKLSLETSLYYIEVADFISTASTVTGTGAPGDPFIIHVPYQNFGNLKEIGSEIEFKYLFTHWLQGIFNYTNYQLWEEEQVDRRFLTPTLQHMFNAQLRAKFTNGFSANLALHYRGSSLWAGPSSYEDAATGITTVLGGKTKEYLIANLRLGYTFKMLKNDAEIALAVNNLFDRHYYDYYESTNPVGRRIIGSFSYKF